ncbi:MAG: bifunctional riboflavin kinase/FAD synthetase [Acidimicrobiia bacterium]
MKIVERLAELRSDAGAAVTIGVYDGVHLGHHEVLRLVRDLADARGLDAVCVTFDRHPAEVVRPDSAPKLLTTLDQKLELLAETGFLDRCFVLHFDEARSRQAAEEFAREVFVDGAGARLVVVGADFHFGARRGGNVALLERMGAELGFAVVGLGLEATSGGVVYSSTRIRELLAEGDVTAATELLGRPHEVRGRVEVGDRRGRELGFPTANLMVPTRVCLPADGIYAGTFVGPDGVERAAAISLGRRPTFYEHAEMSLLEAFVLDFEGDLYGDEVKVRFVERLRGEVRFETVEALVEQMARDVEQTRRLLG